MSEAPSSFWEPCWACAVAAGSPRGHVVAENDQVVVAINPFAVAAGHALVMPRRHVRDLYELPDEVGGAVLSMARRIALAAKRSFRCDGITLRQNNEAASDQHLFHFHLHVIPRFFGDGERFLAAAPLSTDEEQRAMSERLRGGMEEDR